MREIRGTFTTPEHAALAYARRVGAECAAAEAAKARGEQHWPSAEEAKALAESEGLELVPSWTTTVTGYRNVGPSPLAGKFRAYVKENKRTRWLGSAFASAEEAALAYARAIGPEQAAAEATRARKEATIQRFIDKEAEVWASRSSHPKLLGRTPSGFVLQSSKALPHISAIATADPNFGPFTFDSLAALTDKLSPDPVTGHRRHIETADAVAKSDKTAQAWVQYFGSRSQPAHGSRSYKFLNAVRQGQKVMVFDAEGDKQSGTVWELAITICDPQTGSTEEVLFDETAYGVANGYGPTSLSGAAKTRALAAIQSRPNALCIAYGAGPEWSWVINDSGVECIDALEVIRDVMPLMRQAKSDPDPERQWTLGQGLWVPVFGLHWKVFHRGLADCVTEGIVLSALGRALARPWSEGGCMQ